MSREERSRPVGTGAAPEVYDGTGSSVSPSGDEPGEASVRFCWRCYASIDAERPVPVCDTCEHDRDTRRERAERHRVNVKARSDVRPDTRSLIAHARRAAESQMPWRSRGRRWWEVAR